MISFHKRILSVLFVPTLLLIVGTGCNTVNGFGKDVQNAGEGIQNGSK